MVAGALHAIRVDVGPAAAPLPTPLASGKGDQQQQPPRALATLAGEACTRVYAGIQFTARFLPWARHVVVGRAASRDLPPPGGYPSAVGQRRRSPIPQLELPRFGEPLKVPRPRGARQYDHRRSRANRILALRADPLCRRCGAVAEEVHHVVPLTAGGHPWDFGNLEPLCMECHARVHGRRGGKPLPAPPARGPDWCPLY